MSHVRTQIREAAAAALAEVAPVSVSRVYPIAEHELPVLLVSTNEEDIGGGMMGSFARALSLEVECVAQGTNVDMDLDALAVGVERALNHKTLGGLCRPMLPTRFDVRIEAGSVPIGRLRITYQVVYQTEWAEPEVAI
jgi:hypothetical protein